MTDRIAMLSQIAQLGHPFLRAPAGPADLPASDAVRALIADMLATLEAPDAAGSADLAPSLGPSQPNPAQQLDVCKIANMHQTAAPIRPPKTDRVAPCGAEL